MRIGKNFRFLKTAKEKAFAEEMRNKAMEGLGAEKKKRAGDDQPRKKRNKTSKKTSNREGMRAEEGWSTRVQKETNKALAQKLNNSKKYNVQAISRPVENSTTAVPDDVSNVYAATTDKAKHYLNSWKRDIEFTKLIFCCFYYTNKARFSLVPPSKFHPQACFWYGESFLPWSLLKFLHSRYSRRD